MTTLRKLYTGALRLINVVSANEEPSSGDMEITQEAFTGMLESMQADFLNIYTVNPYRFPLVGGQQAYTLGPGEIDNVLTGADWVLPRPMRVERAVLLQGANVAYASEPVPPPVETAFSFLTQAYTGFPCNSPNIYTLNLTQEQLSTSGSEGIPITGEDFTALMDQDWYWPGSETGTSQSATPTDLANTEPNAEGGTSLLLVMNKNETAADEEPGQWGTAPADNNLGAPSKTFIVLTGFNEPGEPMVIKDYYTWSGAIGNWTPFSGSVPYLDSTASSGENPDSLPAQENFDDFFSYLQGLGPVILEMVYLSVSADDFVTPVVIVFAQIGGGGPNATYTGVFPGVVKESFS